jgi:DNA-binding transcriptional LysR family regulator
VTLGDNLAAIKAARFVRERVAPERIVYRVNTVLGLTEAVEAGIGVGPLPCFIADARPALRRLSPVEPEFSSGLWLLTHPDLRAPPGCGPFSDFMARRSCGLRPALEG